MSKRRLAWNERLSKNIYKNTRDLLLNRDDERFKSILSDHVTDAQRLRRLIGALAPVETNFPLVRIGSSGDGGYLVPADLAGLSACYSPGVGLNSDFERHLLHFGIESHLADYSVDGPPPGSTVKSFTKKFVGGVDKAEFMTLDHWLAATASPNDSDFILQMDIEGHEYISIVSASAAALARFRILVIELHHVPAWIYSYYFDIVETAFSRLLNDFHVVHNHPNNHGRVVNIGGIPSPSVFELTLLRKDRSPALGSVTTFPHPLDRPNAPNRADIVLPSDWHG